MLLFQSVYTHTHTCQQPKNKIPFLTRPQNQWLDSACSKIRKQYFLQISPYFSFFHLKTFLLCLCLSQRVLFSDSEYLFLLCGSIFPSIYQLIQTISLAMNSSHAVAVFTVAVTENKTIREIKPLDQDPYQMSATSIYCACHFLLLSELKKQVVHIYYHALIPLH